MDSILHRLALAGAIWLAAFLAVGADNQAREKTRAAGTLGATERLAQSRTSSTRATELREAQAMKDYGELKSARKASQIERFIREHPNTKAATLAKLRVAEIDFQELATQDPFRPTRPSNSSWKGFLQYYAFGSYIPMPEDKELRETYYKQLHPMVLNALEQYNALDGWMAYLIVFPESPYFTTATQRAEDYLTSRSSTWEGYQMLRDYLTVWDKKIKRPCPNREKLVRLFENHLADAALQQGSPEEYQRYVETFPTSARARDIVAATANLKFSEALLKSDRKALDDLVAQYQASDNPSVQANVRRSLVRIEELDFKQTESQNTIQAYLAFQEKYARNDYARLMPKASAYLDRERRQMFAKARAAHGAQQYREFLQIFPNAPERNEASQALEEAEFKEAAATGDSRRIEEVLQRYPHSVFATQGRTRIEQIAFQQAAAEAKSRPTTASLALYISRYPRGAYVKDAEKLIQEINTHHQDYVRQYERARQSRNLSRFGEWLSAAMANYYAAQRGRDDMAALKRELTVRQIIDDVITTPSKEGRRMIAPTIARLLEERARSVAEIESNIGRTTGFIFSEGLVVTHASTVRHANEATIAATIAARRLTCEPVCVAEPGQPEIAILRVNGTAEPIRLGNPAVIEPGERVFCLSAREGKVVHSEGLCQGLRTIGATQWLLIQSDTVPASLGGMVLNKKTEAVALIVPPDRVDPMVLQAGGPKMIYSISARSLLPAIEQAILKKSPARE
jgi:hypothetical protein